jgi:malonyl-CoA O-methyltransferase
MNWFRRKKTSEVLSPLDGYNKWAASYARESNPIKNFSDQLIVKYIPDLSGKSVLDVGCGAGKFCVLAESQGASSIEGIDLSPEMIQHSMKACKYATFIASDISSVALEKAKYDVVICSLVLAHIEVLDATLAKILESLKSDGILALTDFHPFLTLSNSKRTFLDLSTGKKYEVQHYLHLFGEYFNIFHNYGMKVESFDEPLYNNAPAIFGIKAVKS